MDVEMVAKGLSDAQRKAIRSAEEIIRGEWSVNCSDEMLYELALDELVDDNVSDCLLPHGLAVRAHLLREAG